MLVLNFKKKTDNDAWVFKCDASRWYLCLRSERGRSGGCRLVQELRVHLVVMSAQVLSEQVTQDLACLVTNTPSPSRRVHTRLLFQHSTPSLRVQSLSLSQHGLSSASFCSSPPPPPPLFLFPFYISSLLSIVMSFVLPWLLSSFFLISLLNVVIILILLSLFRFIFLFIFLHHC